MTFEEVKKIIPSATPRSMPSKLTKSGIIVSNNQAVEVKVGNNDRIYFRIENKLCSVDKSFKSGIEQFGFKFSSQKPKKKSRF